MSRSFRDAAEDALQPEVVARLDALGALAERLGVPLLLVGGAVRDTLLGRPTRDLDLVVVGDPDPLLRAVEEAVGEVSVATSRLLTHQLELAAGGRLELARARRERYRAPAALPDVAPGSLEDDLGRRDFSINALAVPLGSTWGRVIDLHAGRTDLREGVLRILHPASFRDDPSRVLRGVELAVRLGFRFAEATATAARSALEQGALEALSAARWRTAWARSYGRLLLRDPASLAHGLELASELGLDVALGGRLPPARPPDPERLAAALAPMDATEEEAGRLLLRWLAGDDGELAGGWARRCEMGEETVTAWASFPSRAAALREAFPEGAAWRPSRLDAALAGFDSEERALLAANPQGAYDAILEHHAVEVAPFALAVRGADLVHRGFAPGPAIGRVLAEVRRRRLDGELSAAEELEYACRRLGGEEG